MLRKQGVLNQVFRPAAGGSTLNVMERSQDVLNLVFVDDNDPALAVTLLPGNSYDLRIKALEDAPTPSGTIPDGVVTGDIVRWNAITESWEAKSEPLTFKGLVLTPALSSLVDEEGALYYNLTNKSIMVCTDAS